MTNKPLGDSMDQDPETKQNPTRKKVGPGTFVRRSRDRGQEKSGKLSCGFQWSQQGTRSLGQQITDQAAQASFSQGDNRDLDMETALQYPRELIKSKTWPRS